MIVLGYLVGVRKIVRMCCHSHEHHGIIFREQHKEKIKTTIGHVSASTETCDADTFAILAVETLLIASGLNNRHIQLFGVVKDIVHNMLACNVFYLSATEVIFGG